MWHINASLITNAVLMYNIKKLVLHIVYYDEYLCKMTGILFSTRFNFQNSHLLFWNHKEKERYWNVSKMCQVSHRSHKTRHEILTFTMINIYISHLNFSFIKMNLYNAHPPWKHVRMRPEMLTASYHKCYSNIISLSLNKTWKLDKISHVQYRPCTVRSQSVSHLNF